MPDHFTTQQHHQNMAAIQSKDTKSEMICDVVYGKGHPPVQNETTQ